MKSKHYLHGGDLDAAARAYQIERNSIWDFSGNINPLGISPKARDALKENIDLIATYPDRSYVHLREAVGAYCDAALNDIIVGNGSTELIAAAIGCIKPKRALVIGPSYSEYEREITLIGGVCEYYPLQEENEFMLVPEDLIKRLNASYDLVILCNPNNPTGTAVTAEQLKLILEAARTFHFFIMVDETYVEFCNEPKAYSAVPLVKTFDHLLVIRGISKFFAAPGLRFGYCICSNNALKTAIQKLQNPWSINSLADFAVKIMLTDTTYIKATHYLIVNERKRLLEALSDLNTIHVFPSVTNFVLIKLLKESILSNDLLHELMKDGLLIRDASSFPFLNEHFIRFCFLKPEQNDRLILKLKSYLLAH